MRWEETEMKKFFYLFILTVFSFSGCAEKKENSTDNELTDSDALTSDYESGDNEETDDLWKEGPQLPEMPNPVDWGDCPDGWEPKEEKDEDGNLLAKYCEPLIPDENIECPSGKMPLIGNKECVLMGECPEGDFAEIPTEAGSPVITVAAGNSIQEAIDNAPDGAVISIGKGTFDEIVTLENRSLTLWGSCVSGTNLTSTQPPENISLNAVITVKSSDGTHKAVIHGITVTGDRKGVRITDKGDLKLEHVHIKNTKRQGLFNEVEGKLSTEMLFVSDIRATDDGSQGSGIGLYDKSVTVLKKTSVVKARFLGIGAISDTSTDFIDINMSDILVSDTFSQDSDKTGGIGINLSDNGSIKIERAAVARNRDRGIVVGTFKKGHSATFKASHLFITDTKGQSKDDAGGYGISMQDNVNAEIVKSTLKGNHGFGIHAMTVDLESKMVFSGEDVLVTDTYAQISDKEFGDGIIFMDNVEASLNRVAITKSREIGLLAGTTTPNTFTSIQAENVIIYDIKPNENTKESGMGMGFVDNINLSFNKVDISKTFGVGAGIQTTEPDAEINININNISIRNIESQESDLRWGECLVLSGNIKGIVEKSILESCREMGIYIASAHKSVAPVITFKELTVRNIRLRACAEKGVPCEWAPEALFGHGIGIYDNSEITFVNTALGDNNNGLQIKDAFVLAGDNCSLPSGDNKNNTVCIHLLNNETAINAFDLPEDYDINSAFASEKTYYEGNGLDFSGDEQPIPEPANPMDSMGE
jgi:hypothetical protein